jgi:hypothetical protein
MRGRRADPPPSRGRGFSYPGAILVTRAKDSRARESKQLICSQLLAQYWSGGGAGRASGEGWLGMEGR